MFPSFGGNVGETHFHQCPFIPPRRVTRSLLSPPCHFAVCTVYLKGNLEYQSAKWWQTWQTGSTENTDFRLPISENRSADSLAGINHFPVLRSPGRCLASLDRREQPAVNSQHQSGRGASILYTQKNIHSR